MFSSSLLRPPATSDSLGFIVGKLKVVESTKTILDREDENDSEDVVDLEEFLDLKELVSFNGPCKGPIAVHVHVHSTPQTPVETIIACPVHDQINFMRGYLGHIYSGQVSIIRGISLTSCKGVEVDLGYVYFDGQIYLMYGYLGHVYSGEVSIIRGYHQASLRFCLGDKPNLLFQEGSLVTFMEADTYNFPSLDFTLVDGILITQECFLGVNSAINSSIVISYYLHMNDFKIIGDVLRFGSHILLLSNDESSELDPKISGSHLGMIEKIYLLEPSVVELMPVLEIDGLELLWRPDP
nr:isoamylase 3, chloroplastic [Quercus suber]